MIKKTAQVINGEVRSGDVVIAAGNNDYAYLVGTVTEILPHGTPEHAEETDNATDSIHVNFMTHTYSLSRIKQIEEHFAELTGTEDPVPYDDLSLDDVIMAPDMLIRLSGLTGEFVCDYEKAKAFCDRYAEKQGTISHIYKCSNCDSRRFLASATVFQTWEVDETGEFIKVVNDCDDVLHRPTKNEFWYCAECGTEVPLD